MLEPFYRGRAPRATGKKGKQRLCNDVNISTSVEVVAAVACERACMRGGVAKLLSDLFVRAAPSRPWVPFSTAAAYSLEGLARSAIRGRSCLRSLSPAVQSVLVVAVVCRHERYHLSATSAVLKLSLCCGRFPVCVCVPLRFVARYKTLLSHQQHQAPNK